MTANQKIRKVKRGDQVYEIFEFDIHDWKKFNSRGDPIKFPLGGEYTTITVWVIFNIKKPDLTGYIHEFVRQEEGERHYQLCEYTPDGSRCSFLPPDDFTITEAINEILGVND